MALALRSAGVIFAAARLPPRVPDDAIKPPPPPAPPPARESEPSRDQIAKDYALTLTIIDRLGTSNADLLAACKLYEVIYVTSQHHPSPGEEAIVMNAVSAAIAKAEGRG
jgi:hypothetical protein